ncbi:MAG: UDP-N-acetylglucosamine pyrophosphorylase [Firmicutes bacterium]|nr:UDP-N-acetylglucosamine pyrophosphorylase [Bacillota bacterium]
MLNVHKFFSWEGCPTPDVFLEVHYPWEVLAYIPRLIDELLKDKGSNYTQIAPGVWIGEGTTVADTARFQGSAIFGKNCEIRPNAYVRGNVIAGDGVVLGNSSEVKQSILFSKVQLPHFNYVGDSILGRGVHLGAGAIISNFKSTKEPVKVRVGEEVIETGLRKLGAILGDEVEIGCNAVLNPGTLIGAKTVVYPLSSVRGYIAGGMIYKGSGDIVPYT